MTARYELCLEMVERESTLSGLSDFRLARTIFHSLAGAFEENEPWFEIRMTMFLDWYLLQRRGEDGRTPTEGFLHRHRETLDEPTLCQLNNLSVSLRSVFQIRRMENDQFLIDDLIRGGQWEVQWILPLSGLRKGDILNTRLILCGDQIHAGRGTVMHPGDAEEPILRIIERAEKENMSSELLIHYLDKVKLKLDRYSNVKIRHVYQYPSEQQM